MQQLPPIPMHQGNPNGHITSGMGGRSRGRGRARGGGGQRRNDYHVQRHMQQQLQLQAQQQQLPPDGASPSQNVMQLQQDHMGQQLAQQPPPEGQLAPLSYYAPQAYPAYGGYQTAYFAPHHGPIQTPPIAAAAAQQATGHPLYISPVPLYNGAPMYNYMGDFYINNC